MTAYVTARSFNPNDRATWRGSKDETIELLHFGEYAGNCNCFVSRYRWIEKQLRSSKRVLDYIACDWKLTGFNRVGVWLLIYCGPELRASGTVEQGRRPMFEPFPQLEERTV